MGYIYLIHQEDTDYWKIGRTKKPLDRIKKHRNSNISTAGYTAIFEVEDDVLSETVLFRRLNKYRYDDREFFELPIDELKDLEKNIIGIKTVFYSEKFLSIIKEAT
jgi:hypothetical protein